MVDKEAEFGLFFLHLIGNVLGGFVLVYFASKMLHKHIQKKIKTTPFKAFLASLCITVTASTAIAYITMGIKSLIVYPLAGVIALIIGYTSIRFDISKVATTATDQSQI